MINDFMIQIIRGLGGGEKELGYSNFLQAILELPVMALIGFVLKKISSRNLLVFSGGAFFVKILIMLVAGNMAVFYFSQSIQLFAYAIFIPAAAYYVSQNMEELDQVKGQAYITSAITIGGVFSNLISGVSNGADKAEPSQADIKPPSTSPIIDKTSLIILPQSIPFKKSPIA